jgi:AbrB family looped-hinge helix DNA binding protein
MRATGIVRRIDDLGRVVIPKEIRRAMKIKEGDPLEIYTDPSDGMVCFKKYSTMEDIISTEMLQGVAENISKILDRDIFIVDTAKILANTISPLYNGETTDYNLDDRTLINIKVAYSSVIVNEGDDIGYIVVCGENTLAHCQEEMIDTIAKTMAIMLGK